MTDLTYARAYDKAKKDLQFLLVVPLSPEHDATSDFVRKVLLSTRVVDYLQATSNKVIVWAGSVADPEPYQVATVLNVTRFPFAALIAHTPAVSSTAMSVIARLESPTDISTSDAFIAKVDAAVRQHSNPLQQVRAQQSEQQASRDLRDQQNSAYERSLATDRARAQAKRDAERAEQDAQQAERRRIVEHETHEQKLRQWKQWRARRLRPEPKSTKDGTRVSIRLLDGTRLVRTFDRNLSLEELYAFVECYDQVKDKDLSHGGDEGPEAEPKNFSHSFGFRLVSPMPREVYESHVGLIGDRIGRSGNLIVEKIDDYD